MNTPWDGMTRSWTELVTRQADLAKDWFDNQNQLAGALTRSAGDTPDDTNPLADAAAVAELWRSWVALGGSLGRLPGATAGGGIAAETLGRITDPWAMSLAGGGQVGDTIRRMTEGPRFADIGAAEHRLVKMTDLWLSVQAAARDYEGIVAGAWMKANGRFTQDLATRTGTDEEVRTGKQALRRWLEIADQTLIQTHRTPEFLAAQRKLLARGMEFLLAEREVVEALVEPSGLPTRTEIDEIHQTVLDLKRRVRVLERAAGAAASTATDGTQTTDKRASRKSTAGESSATEQGAA